MLNHIKQHFVDYGKLYSVIAIFLMLTAAQNVSLPLGRGYDEFAHFAYIRFFAENHRPPATVEERGQAGYKARVDPPFYHAVTGLLFSWVDSKETIFKRVRYGDIPQQALLYEVIDINWILQTEIMKYPYQGAVLLWHLSRFFSSLLGVAALVFTYLIARQLFPQRQPYPLLAVASVAFIPRFVYSGGVISDDNMLALLLAIYLYLMVRVIKGETRWPVFVVIGVLLGIAVTTKFSVGLVPLTTLLFLCVLAWRQRWTFKALIKRSIIVTISALLAAGWWFGFVIWHFNQIETQGLVAGTINAIVPQVANNVSGTDLFNVLLEPGVVEQKPLLFGQWFAHMGQTFWAVPFISTTEGFPLQPAAFWIIAFIFGGVVFGLLKTWQRGSEFERLWLLLLSLHLFAVLPLMLIRYYLNGIIFETGQGRHILMPGAAAVGILLAVGWSKWPPQGRLKWTRSLLPIFLFSWSGLHLHSIYNTYPETLPLDINSIGQPTVDIPLQITYFDAFELIGYTTQLESDQSSLAVELTWQQMGQPSPKDYLTEVRLLDSQGQVVTGQVQHPADGLYPTRVWQHDEIIYDRLKLPLHNIKPGSYTLEASLLKAYQPTRQVAIGPLLTAPVTLSAVRQPSLNFKTLTVDSGTQPLTVNYQLWPFDFWSFSRPVYHHRSTISVAWQATSSPGQQVRFSLVGPDGQTFQPIADYGNIKTFIVAAQWPAGLYRLKAEVWQGETRLGEAQSPPLLQINNRERHFTPPAIPYPVEANFYDHIKLLGYDLPDRRIEPGEALPVFVYWQGVQIINADLKMFNHLYDLNNQQWSSFDHVLPPYYGGPIMWVPGEVVTDGYSIPTPPDIPDGIYQVRTGLFLGMGNDAWVPLPLVVEGQQTDVTYVTLGPIKIGSAPANILANDVAPQYIHQETLGDIIQLKGYDLTVVPDKTAMTLTLYWQSLSPTDRNLTTFIHVLDQTGQLIAQQDNPPANGSYPTSLWEAGEIIEDKHELSLTADLALDNTHLKIGLYDTITGERLSVEGTTDNAILLSSFEIAGLVK